MTALNILSGNHRDIGIRLQFLVGCSRRRDDGLAEHMLICGTIFICSKRLHSPQRYNPQCESGSHCHTKILLHVKLLLKHLLLTVPNHPLLRNISAVR